MSAAQIEVHILGQPYRLACAPEKQAALLEAAARVDAEMNKVRSHSAIRGTDRIAVMAAISLASELLLLQRSVQCGEAVPAQEIQTIVQRLNQQIGTALEPHDLLSPEDHVCTISGRAADLVRSAGFRAGWHDVAQRAGQCTGASGCRAYHLIS